MKAFLEKPCRVYWGSHGCDKVRGHGGEHICKSGTTGSYCSSPPIVTDRLATYWEYVPCHNQAADVTLDPQLFYGEDVELYQILGMEC